MLDEAYWCLAKYIRQGRAQAYLRNVSQPSACTKMSFY